MMKKRHKFSEENNGMNGGSSGGGQQNNTQNNTPTYANLWDKTETSGVAPAQPQQNPQQQQQPSDPTAAFNAHVESLRLTDGINFQQVANDLAQGNHTSLEAAFKSLGANSYRAGVSDAQRLMNGKIDDAVNKAVNQSTGNYKSDMIVNRMNDSLPFTKAPEIAPIAKAVLTQMISKGKTHDEAIEEVGKFFQHVGNTVNHNTQAPEGNPGSRNYNNRQTTTTDWDEIFTSLAQQ
jgi:hypothetical protein